MQNETRDVSEVRKGLGLSLDVLAAASALSVSQIRFVETRPESSDPRTVRNRLVYARALMAWRLAQGGTAEQAWQLNEAELFGMAEPDREIVMGEVRAAAERIRKQRAEEVAAR